MTTSTAIIQPPIGKVGHELVIHNAERAAHWEVPHSINKGYQHARVSVRTYPAQVMKIEITEQGRKSAREAWLDLNEQQVATLRDACDLALGDSFVPASVLADALRRIAKSTAGYDSMSTMGCLHEIATAALDGRVAA
jgi:hypothetical protein